MGSHGRISRWSRDGNSIVFETLTHLYSVMVGEVYEARAHRARLKGQAVKILSFEERENGLFFEVLPVGKNRVRNASVRMTRAESVYHTYACPRKRKTDEAPKTVSPDKHPDMLPTLRLFQRLASIETKLDALCKVWGVNG